MINKEGQSALLSLMNYPARAQHEIMSFDVLYPALFLHTRNADA